MFRTALTPALLILLIGAGVVLAWRGATAGETAPATPQVQSVELEFLGGAPNRPFSEAVRVGNLLFLSGKIGSVPGQGLAEGGIQAETRATMENIKGALERHGSSMDRVFKCLVILADMSEFRAMNEVYMSYFPGDKPARSAFAASGLAAGARVEIECIATVG